MTPLLRLAAAQSTSLAGDVAGNVAAHGRYIETAAAAGVDILVFPELSLSGYEPDLTAGCALTAQDAVLQPLQEKARAARMIVIAGAPLLSAGARPYIGVIVFFPDRAPLTYCKRYLHPGEEVFAEVGEAPSCTFRRGGDCCALAVCADTTQEQHMRDAVDAGANLYLAGVLWSAKGYAADAAQLQTYATEYPVAILMANHGAPSGGYAAAGRSGVWAPGGKQVVVAPADGACLVVATRRADLWTGEVLPALQA
jgi:predicted amidohydrolase